MEKRGMIIEIIIKSLLAIIALLSIVFIICDIVGIFPLFGVFKMDEDTLNIAILNSPIGPTFKNMGIVDSINGNVIKDAIISFIVNINGYVILNLSILIALLVTYFVFIRWDLILGYIKVYGFITLFFILKYVLFAFQFVLFYKDDLRSIAISIFIGNIMFILVSLIEIFCFSLFIMRFAFNIKKDLTELKLLENI